MEVMRASGPLRPDLYLLGGRHLDLSEIPAVVREERGLILAQQLYEILSAVKLPAEDFQNPPAGEEITLYRQPSGRAISLRRQPDGRWLFSAETVEAIPGMYQALTAKGKIELAGSTVLDRELLGIRGTIWLILLLVPLIAYLAACLLIWALRISVGKLVSTRYGIGTQQQKAVLRPLGWLVASLVFWIGLCVLELPAGLLLVLAGVIKVVATLAAITVAFRLADAASHYARLLTSRTGSTFDDMLIPLGRRCCKVLLGALGLLFLAQNLDIEVWSLFAGFSIFGAMVALAGQDTVKNFFGSLTVLADRPFAVGDSIVVEGIEGVVEDVGFRSTRIRTFYDSLVTLPNSRLITASVDNYGRRKFRRYSTKLSVRWNTPPSTLEAFCEGLRELVRQHPYTRKDSYQVWINDFNEYALEVLIYVFFVAPDWGTELRERHRFLLDIHRLATDLGVELAYPSQRLLLSRHEERPESDYDRDLQAQALSTGRSTCQAILDRTLPRDRPPPLMVDEKGRWVAGEP
jgi:MscS family membrane protein